MQNADVGLAPLVNCELPVCPVTGGTEPKMQHARGWRNPAGLGRILGLVDGFLWAGPGFRPDPLVGVGLRRTRVK